MPLLLEMVYMGNSSLRVGCTGSRYTGVPVIDYASLRSSVQARYVADGAINIFLSCVGLLIILSINLMYLVSPSSALAVSSFCHTIFSC